MKGAFIAMAAAFLFSACEKFETSGKPAPAEWLVGGEVEPLGQFVFPRDEIAGGSGTLIGPGSGQQNYRIFIIDARTINGGTIRATLKMDPEGQSAASMDLFDGEAFIPADLKEQEELRMSPHRLESHYGDRGIKPGDEAVLEYPFSGGQIFQLGITGDWFSPPGASTDFELEVEVDSYRN